MRRPIIIDTGRLTKRIMRKMRTRPDVWSLSYSSSEQHLHGKPCIYVLEFIRSRDCAVCFWVGSYDLEEVIEECRARGLRGVRGVI